VAKDRKQSWKRKKRASGYVSQKQIYLKTREERRSVIIIARRLYRKWRVMNILQVIVNDTMTESECITMIKSDDYTVTESGEKRV